MVLDQLQRKAKRQLIAENRQRRETAVLRDKIIHDLITDKMTNEDKKLIQELAGAFQRELAPSPIIDHVRILECADSESAHLPLRDIF